VMNFYGPSSVFPEAAIELAPTCEPDLRTCICADWRQTPVFEHGQSRGVLTNC